MNTVFHIGYHKTGTTWLQKGYFSEQPEISLSCNSAAPWNDPFLSHLIGRYDYDFDKYKCRALMAAQLVSGKVNVFSAERLSGHPFSGGYDNFRICERIHSCDPDAKILIVIRHQVDMLVSMYRQLVRAGYLGRFVDLVDAKHWKGTGPCLSMYKYDLLINKYRAVFGASRVMVLTYEELDKEPSEFLGKLSRYFGVSDYVPSNRGSKTNAAIKNSTIEAVRILNRFRKTEFNPFPVVCLKENTVYMLAKKIDRMIGRMEFLDVELRSRLNQYYFESNKRLGVYPQR